MTRITTTEKSTAKDPAELAQAEVERESGATVVAATLAGDGQIATSTAADVITHGRAELDTLERAIGNARAEREAAVFGWWRARADDVREKAAALREEADARQPTTDRLLAQLREWEGVTYAPLEPPRGQSFDVVRVPTPRTTLLRMEAKSLDVQAEGFLKNRVNKNAAADFDGSLDAVDVEHIVAQMTSDPMTIGAIAHIVRDWLTAGLAHERNRRKGMAEDSASFKDPVRINVRWTNGELDRASSGISPVVPPLVGSRVWR